MHGLKDIKAMNERAARTPRGVNIHVSDLFFNRDLSDAYRGGRYEEDRLRVEAQMLLDNLRHLGVEPLPTADQLVKDFLARL